MLKSINIMNINKTQNNFEKDKTEMTNCNTTPDSDKNKCTFKDGIYIFSNICISLSKFVFIIFQAIFIFILLFVYLCIKPIYTLTEKIIKKLIKNVESIVDTETIKLNSIITKYSKKH